MTRLDVVNYLSHGIAKLGEEGEQPSSSSDGEGRIEGGEGEPKGDALTEFASNLNEQARSGRIDPLVGRADEIDAPSRSCAAAAEQPAVRGRGRRGQDRDCRGPGPAASSRVRCPTCWPTR